MISAVEEFTKSNRIIIKHIEQKWFDYTDNVKQIEVLRQGILNPFDAFPDENQGGGVNSVRNISDTTADTAIRLCVDEDINRLNNRMREIERVYNALPDNHKKLVRLRYWSRNNERTWEGIAMQLEISKRQALRWRDQIMQATIEVMG